MTEKYGKIQRSWISVHIVLKTVPLPLVNWDIREDTLILLDGDWQFWKQMQLFSNQIKLFPNQIQFISKQTQLFSWTVIGSFWGKYKKKFATLKLCLVQYQGHQLCNKTKQVRTQQINWKWWRKAMTENWKAKRAK